MERLRPRHFLLLAVLAAGVYANSLGVPYLFDDELEIQVNPRVHRLAEIPSLLTAEFYTGARGRGLVYRPVLAAAVPPVFLAGGGRPWPFHAVNIFLHALVCCLLAAIAARLTGSSAAGMACGVLFAVHPIHVEAVTWISGRSELFYTAAGAGAWLLHLRAREGRKGAALGSLACLMLALGSKETAFAWPFIFVITDLLFPANQAGGQAEGWGLWRRSAYSLRGALYAGYAVELALFLGLRRIVLGHMGLMAAESVQDALLNPLAGRPWWPSRPFTWLRTLFLALRMTVAPVRQCIDYGFNAIPVVSGPLHADVLAGMLFLGATIAMGWRFLRGGFRKVWQRTLLLGVAVFLLSWLPPSGLLISSVSIFSERNLYLPSLGWCLTLAILWVAVRQRWEGGRRWIAAGGVALAAIMGFATVARNSVFRDHLSLLEDTVSHCPNDARALYLLGGELLNLHRPADAVRAFRKALAIAPDHADAMADLAKALARSGSLPEARAEAERAASTSGLPVQTGLDVVGALDEAGLHDKADGMLGELRNRDPNDQWVLYLAAQRARTAGKKEEALRLFEEIRSKFPGSLVGDLGIGQIRLEDGDLPAARRSLERAAALDPYDPEAIYSLGLTYLRILPRQPQLQREALDLFERYVRLRPNGPNGWLRLAETEELLGDLGRAEAAYRKASALAPPGTLARRALEGFLLRSKRGGGTTP